MGGRANEKPYRYCIATLSIYRDTDTRHTDTDLRQRTRQREKKEKEKQNATSAAHVTVGDAEAPQGFRMKASSLLSRQRAWQLRFPEKRRAHEAVRQALLKGVLVKQPCAECGATHNVDGHHPDYAQPLVVTWLCRRHHAARHRKPILKKGPRP